MIENLKHLWPLILLAPLVGCTAHRASFQGHDPDAVWTAMVMTAQSPDYGDMDSAYRWDVRENEVWTDKAAGRIEIYRRLHRTVTQPVKLSRTEDREWSFHIRFDRGPAPSAMFDCRQTTVPAWVQDEADRYFASVRKQLEDMSLDLEIPAASQPGEPPAAPPETQPAEDDTELEELLDPDGTGG